MTQLVPSRAASLGALHASAPRPPARTQPGPPGAQPAEPARPWEPLVHDARRGDPEAFAGLVDVFGPRVLAYLLRLTRHQQDAEDLTQETFVKAHRMLGGFATPRAFPAWIFTIARRTALNHFRARRTAEPVDPELACSDPDPAQRASSQDAWTTLWALARGELKSAQFEVLWLRYGEDLSVAEIARVTRRSSLHVRVLLHRGRNALLPLAERISQPDSTL